VPKVSARLFLCESCLPPDRAPEELRHVAGTRQCNGCGKDFEHTFCHLYDAQQVALMALSHVKQMQGVIAEVVQ
jgi:hypothetical protein